MLASVIEVEVVKLFHTGHISVTIQVTLSELGDPQPPTSHSKNQIHFHQYINSDWPKNLKTYGHEVMLVQILCPRKTVYHLLETSKKKLWILFHKTSYSYLSKNSDTYVSSY